MCTPTSGFIWTFLMQIAYLKVYKVECTPNWNRSTFFCFVFMGFKFISADPGQGSGCARSLKQPSLLVETTCVFCLCQCRCPLGSGRPFSLNPCHNRKKLSRVWKARTDACEGPQWCRRDCRPYRAHLELLTWRLLGELLSTFAVKIPAYTGKDRTMSHS